MLLNLGHTLGHAVEALAGYRGVQLDKPFTTEEVEHVLELVS